MGDRRMVETRRWHNHYNTSGLDEEEIQARSQYEREGEDGEGVSSVPPKMQVYFDSSPEESGPRIMRLVMYFVSILFHDRVSSVQLRRGITCTTTSRIRAKRRHLGNITQSYSGSFGLTTSVSSNLP